MNGKTMASVFTVLVLLASPQLMAASSVLNLKDKLKVEGCGSEVEFNPGLIVFGGNIPVVGKKFVAQAGAGNSYTGKYKYSSSKRLYKMELDNSSEDDYEDVIADWAAELCGVNNARVKNVNYKNFSLKLNKNKTKGKFRFSATMTGKSSGQSATVKHNITGKGPYSN